MAEYRITITGAEATDRDSIRLPCTIEKDDGGGGGWATVEGAPDELYLPTTQVLAILRKETTEQQQRAELLDAVRKLVRNLSVLQSDVAADRLEELLPSGWPVTVGV